VSERIAEIVILGEDLRQVNLVRRYLQCCGHDGRCLRVPPLSGGRGSGEQRVRLNYPTQVQAYRDAARRRKAALVVIIDADTRTLHQRRQELVSALEEAKLAPRDVNEAIALLIPKRNVETWILCLTGDDVDEETDYKGRIGLDQKIKAASRFLWERTRPNFVLPLTCVDSLREAIPELARIPEYR
jgi:hypothetical protein